MSLIKLAQYSPPYSTEYLKENYPNLLKDPVHAWRAKTGIELIHKEPSEKEQKRIWKNWQQMTPEQQIISDKQSIKFFGKSNKDNQMGLVKLAAKLPPQVAAIFHDLVKGGMKPGHAAAKAWGEVRRSGVEITPAVKAVAKIVKKADNGVQGSLFNPEEFTQTWKRIKR